MCVEVKHRLQLAYTHFLLYIFFYGLKVAIVNIIILNLLFVGYFDLDWFLGIQ